MECVPDIPRIGDFDEAPSPPGPGVVDGGHPEIPGGGDLGGLLCISLTADFDDEIQRVVGAVPVVDGTRIVGILTNSDMLQGLVRTLAQSHSRG